MFVFIWRLHLLSSLCVAVEETAAVASVSLRPLEGMDTVEVAAARAGVALGELLKLCSNWQKPGAVVQGQCVLVSRTKFEVDIIYHVDVIAAFKQMPTKNYGNRQMMQLICFSCLLRNLFSCHILQLLIVCVFVCVWQT